MASMLFCKWVCIVISVTHHQHAQLWGVGSNISQELMCFGRSLIKMIVRPKLTSGTRDTCLPSAPECGRGHDNHCLRRTRSPFGRCRREQSRSGICRPEFAQPRLLLLVRTYYYQRNSERQLCKCFANRFKCLPCGPCLRSWSSAPEAHKHRHRRTVSTIYHPCLKLSLPYVPLTSAI